MSMLGNQSYTGVVNTATQFSNLNTANLTAVNSIIQTETITGDLIVENNITVGNDATIQNDLVVNGGVDINGTLPGPGNIGLDVANNITGESFRTTGQAVVSGGVTCSSVTTNGIAGIVANVTTPGSNPGRVVRVSAIGANSWEDGNMGNAQQLIFTPSDFMVANPRSGAGIGASVRNFVNMATEAVGWNEPRGGGYGHPSLVTINNGGPSETCLVATKLIPKGFVVKDGSALTIHAASNVTPTTVSVAIRTINDPGQVGDVAVLSPYQFNTTVPLSGLGVGGDNLGTGTNMIILYIEPGVQLTTTVGGIWGASIDMSRI